MKKEIHILNLTQHKPSPEQLEIGVYDPPIDIKEKIIRLITFDKLEDLSYASMRVRANELASLAKDICKPSRNIHREGDCVFFVLIGGAPYFARYLEDYLISYGIEPLYAFSERKSVEIIKEDGSVVKQSVFQHKGFYNAKFGRIETFEIPQYEEGL